ncbi:MAG: polyprenyl synthetase family protein, partial [Flavobacteriales bacterium]
MEKKVETYREWIETALGQVLDAREGKDPLYSPIAHMLSMGGKRLRPVALMIAAEMFGGNADKALPGGVGVELFHNFTLMHDDLMDEAPLRRGKETVHNRYGRNMAILAGDAMLVKAYQEMGKLEPSKLPKILEDFDRVALEVCEGQRADMEFEERTDVEVDEYLRMIASKTGALLGGALAIGARIGGAGEKDLRRMELLGRNIGSGFQIQDDILDLYGDEGKFGKQKGGDIIGRKKTYLLIRAFEKADTTNRERLMNVFNGSDSEKERIRGVRQVYDELGIEADSRERCDAYFEEGRKALEQLSLEEERKSALKGL